MANPGPNDRDRLLSLEQKVQGWVRDAAENRDRQDQEILEIRDGNKEVIEGLKYLITLAEQGKADVSLLRQSVDQLRARIEAIENNQNADRDLLEEVNAIAAEYKSSESAIKQRESGKFNSYLFALILAGFLAVMSYGAYERKQELSIGVWMPCLVLIGLALGVNVDPGAIGSLVVKK